MERTFIIIKPNSVQRELIGDVISRFEKRGLKISAMKLTLIDKVTAKKHYSEHVRKKFYHPLIKFIISGPSVVMILEGEQAVEIVRQMCGTTDPLEADPGTIRGDYGMSIRQNIIHASDSIESAEREINLFFKKEEIIDYKLAARPWI